MEAPIFLSPGLRDLAVYVELDSVLANCDQARLVQSARANERSKVVGSE